MNSANAINNIQLEPEPSLTDAKSVETVNEINSSLINPPQLTDKHNSLLNKEQVKFSHFDNIADKSPRVISSEDFTASISTGIIYNYSIKGKIEKIRSISDQIERNRLKKSLPAVTISSICIEGHRKENIQSLTGFIQIDIDKLENVTETKEILKQDSLIYILFLSPSGNGLKCIINIGVNQPSEVFESIRLYFKEKYAIEIDNQVKDESRLCFYSYDPDIYINENTDEFIYKPKIHAPIQLKYTIKVEELITKVESKSIDITSDYKDWLMIGFALSDEFGPDGEAYYHRLSRFYQNYDYLECSKQYNSCLNSGSKTITIKNLFSLASKKLEILNSSAEKEENKFQNIEDIVFYTPSYDKDGNLKDIKIDYTLWIDILYQLGFRRFDIDKNFVFVRICNQIIEEVSVTHIQDAFIHFLENLPEQLNDGISREFLIGKFYRNPSHYFCENRLNLLRPKDPFVFMTDTKDVCFIFFKNGFVRCTNDGYQLFPYENLDGLIWKSQIIDHDFSFLDFTLLSPLEKGEFSTFIFNVCGKDQERYNALITILGYSLHSHFSGKLKAVVLTDGKISNVPSGRTGKTLVGQALGFLKKYTEINGKDFDFDNKHKYQEAELDTQILHLNDVKKNFDFERLFNDITEGLVVDKKNIKPFKVRAKMIISTNKTICIEGASAKDRAIEFEFSDYYSEKFSPEDEFHHWFFRDWSLAEWMNFFNFFLFCISSYLKTGVITATQVNLNRRKLLENTCEEFVEFMDDQVKNKEIIPGFEYNKKDLFDRFLIDSPEYAEIKAFKQKRFTEYLRSYARYSEYFSPIDPEKDERKSGTTRYIIFPPP